MNKHSGRPNKHSGLDKYYSKPQVAENITRILKAYILENKLENTFDQIVEPSGGDGAFVGPLKGFGKPVDAFDIAPEHPLVREKDFFEFTCSAPTVVSQSFRIPEKALLLDTLIQRAPQTGRSQTVLTGQIDLSGSYVRLQSRQE